MTQAFASDLTPPQVPEFQNGPLFVVESASTFSADRSKAHVCVQSQMRDWPRAIEGLSGNEARTLALAFASARGLAPASLNGMNIGPYPVNSQGTPLELVAEKVGHPLDPRDPLMQIGAYRVEVLVCRRM